MADEPRVLVLGPIDSPHLGRMAVAMRERGHTVAAAGYRTPGMPPYGLEEHGVEVLSALDRPKSFDGYVRDNLQWHKHWIKGLVRRFHPDVIHAHWFHIYPFLAIRAGATPLVATPWGSDVYLKQGARDETNRLVATQADAITEHVPQIRERILALGAAQERLAHVKWGVDLAHVTPPEDRAQAREELGLGSGPVILSPRGPRPNNNMPVVLEAFDLLADQRDDVQLVLTSPSGKDIELPGMRHPDRVHVAGHVSQLRMAGYYRAADACISIPTSDGSPNSVWEAMARGCPCVLSDLPWLEGMVKRDEEALVVPIEAEPLAKALERILDDRAFASSLAARGRALVEAEHDMARHMDRLSELLGDVAGAAR